MKNEVSLPRLLAILIGVEVACYIAVLLLPAGIYISETSASYEQFWSGVYYLLGGLWVIGWVAVVRRWSKCLEIYAAGWLASFIAGLLSLPTIEVPLSSTLGYLSTLAGGGVLVLVWLRNCGIGDWAQVVSSRHQPPGSHSEESKEEVPVHPAE